MTIFPFIMDSRPAWLSGDTSLLLTPQGTRTLLAQICAVLAERIQDPATILTAFTPSDAYQEAIRRERASAEAIAPAENFGRLLSTYEPSDWILLIDPRHYPVSGLNLRAFLSRRPEARAARHLIALDISEQGTKEYLQFDPAGQVRRIQRYYEGVTWLHASVVSCSMASVACLRLLGQPAFDSLLEVRGGLAACGVPSEDVLLAGGTMDLHDARNMLKLAERGIVRLCQDPPKSYRPVGRDVWAATSSRIDPTARIEGPVLVQDNATIEAGATVIGPALLGTGSVVGRGATIAQCLLMQQAEVLPASTIHHKVIGPQDAEGGGDLAPLEAVSGPAACSLSSVGRLECEHPRRIYAAVKQGIDRVFALLGLILMLPLLIVAAGLVKLDSRGPLLFGHEREGKGGRPFRCWKFRTMISGAHAKQRALYAKSGVDGPQFKIDNDPRITRIGRIFRKTNIDELPQLVNVLAGQMSLIGPRPSPFRENQICIPWRQARLSVRPGITGLWQICRSNRAAGDFHQWIYYDMLYVRHMSFWLDIKILAATLITFGGRWGVPVTWIIPPRKLYSETRPWVIPMLEAPAEPTA